MADKEALLPFELIEEEFGEGLTSYSGLPFVMETCEVLGLGRLVKQHVRSKHAPPRLYRVEGKGQEQGVTSILLFVVLLSSPGTLSTKDLIPSRFGSWPLGDTSPALTRANNSPHLSPGFN